MKTTPSPLSQHFPRRLTSTNADGQVKTVDEHELLSIKGSIVVLAEPGMGKSVLISELARRLDAPLIGATRLMHHATPKTVVVDGQALLIDGLDEAMARREGDAVDLILKQLEIAGSPDFILTCRSIDWQARTLKELRQIYGAEPTVWTLQALDCEQAVDFLRLRFPAVDARNVIETLNEHGLTGLHGNPLMLGMIGRVAEADGKLPTTRAALFDRACRLTWSEHDPDRADTDLSCISEEAAMAAAGAIMAGLIIAGADSVSTAIPSQIQAGEVRLAELAQLGSKDEIHAVFRSKLFLANGAGRASPVHRVIAEFLGAKWLGTKATAPRTRRRLLRQFSGHGIVPASLRGLHAWLAFHSPAMASDVIAADPLGVLRYGDSTALTAEQADCLFNALQALSTVDPYFREGDWDSHTASGMMVANLLPKIKSTISAIESNDHFRSLLIESLQNAALASQLTEVLESVLLSTERFYREREAAAMALKVHRERVRWLEIVEELRCQGTEDSTRLAKNIVEAMDCDIPDELLVDVLLAEMGRTVCAFPRGTDRFGTTLHYHGNIVRMLNNDRLINILDLLSEHAAFSGDERHEVDPGLRGLVASLATRAIRSGTVTSVHAPRIWHWLWAIRATHDFEEDPIAALREQLDNYHDLRRAIQDHALHVARSETSVWVFEAELDARMIGFARRPHDVAWFLNHLSAADNKDPVFRDEWRDLMRFGLRPDGIEPQILLAGQTFLGNDTELSTFLHDLEHPRKPDWLVKQDHAAAKRKSDREVAREQRRAKYLVHRQELRGGELQWIVDPALVYLGQLRTAGHNVPPAERLSDWMGPDLAEDAMAGFEAVLHRRDIPSPQRVSDNYAERKIPYYCFAINAGLFGRLRAGQSLSDLSVDVQKTGLLICQYDMECHYDRANDSRIALRGALEKIVLVSESDREQFARLLIEPALIAGNESIPGLHELTHFEVWQSVGKRLAEEWLLRFTDLPDWVELQLVDLLLHTKALVSLRLVASTRSSSVFRNEIECLKWCAIDALVRFETVRSELADIGQQEPKFIWQMRNRLQLETGRIGFQPSLAQAHWIVAQFRTSWPYASWPRSRVGDTGPYDATQFLMSMIEFIASDVSNEAIDALGALLAAPPDTYSSSLRHQAAQQKKKLVETAFEPLSPSRLAALLEEGTPSTIGDLKAVVLEELAIAQKRLKGDEFDPARDFWVDGQTPHDENRCRDRLGSLISTGLERFGIRPLSEADMPHDKRADLAFSCGQLQLPMEVKGQWHSCVWDAATQQLDTQYLIDWRSEQQGIYCVLWFGDLPAASRRRLKRPPNGENVPTSVDEMQKMLLARIPESRRPFIDVVVLDLTGGRPSENTTQ